jgi:tyrosinase
MYLEWWLTRTAARRNALKTTEKKEWIAAVKCLQTKPSIADPTFATGARTRYDDFVSVHMAATLEIHGTVSYPTTRSCP